VTSTTCARLLATLRGITSSGTYRVRTTTGCGAAARLATGAAAGSQLAILNSERHGSIFRSVRSYVEAGGIWKRINMFKGSMPCQADHPSSDANDARSVIRGAITYTLLDALVDIRSCLFSEDRGRKDQRRDEDTNPTHNRNVCRRRQQIMCGWPLV
jgi:hypothetical protein